jgi:FAD/FMN-containing dehydrogenase
MSATSVRALSELVKSGTVEGYTPDQAEYATLSLPMNKRFKPSPSFIFYPKSTLDISSIMGLVYMTAQTEQGLRKRSAITVAVRSGGHNYAAFSSGEGAEGSQVSIVIDMKHFNEITYDAAMGVTTIGAGCRLDQVAEDLAKVGRALPRMCQFFIPITHPSSCLDYIQFFY